MRTFPRPGQLLKQSRGREAWTPDVSLWHRRQEEPKQGKHAEVQRHGTTEFSLELHGSWQGRQRKRAWTLQCYFPGIGDRKNPSGEERVASFRS